jgi:chorismate mutase
MAEPSRTQTPPEADPVLAQFREQITDNDRAIMDAINKRLKLVAQIKRYKAARNMPFLDTAREEWMLRYLSRANRGPLSEEGLRELYTEILDLTKREVARAEER